MRRFLGLLTVLAILGCEDGPIELDPTMIRIYNQSTATINAVHFPRCGVFALGQNLLNPDVSILPGRLYDFLVVPDCYDIYVINTTGGDASLLNSQLVNGQMLTFTVTTFD
jgi:hypothetical protein